MQTRGLRHIALAMVLCIGVVGCSHNPKGRGGKHAGYDASTRGAGEGGRFAEGDAARDMMAQRKIYFDYDHADIHPSDYEIIQAHADYLRSNPQRRVRLEGHTDEHGSREYNIGLGERRSRAVAAALSQNGVAPQQIATVSFGKEKPESLGQSEESHRLNRRAVIVYEE